jgi:ATP-binding cassette subfamily B protein
MAPEGEGLTANTPELLGRVEFDHVTFGYDPEKPVLKEITFCAEPGQLVAIVGHSGAGKTSLINLLCRFYHPQSGVIRIDSHDISQMELDSYRRQIALVLQDPFLFSGTIRENLRYGSPDATDNHMLAALDAAGLTESFRTQGTTLDTMLHERGENLSSGQRQLLSFARAILADPRLIILDEATAHVDTITERRVQAAMERLLQGRTAFVIAHRLSTIQAANQILLIHHGQITERGTHAELIAKQGLYWRLCREQGAWTEEPDLPDMMTKPNAEATPVT